MASVSTDASMGSHRISILNASSVGDSEDHKDAFILQNGYRRRYSNASSRVTHFKQYSTFSGETQYMMEHISQSRYISCFQLSLWHEVYGPKMEHVWAQLYALPENPTHMDLENQKVSESLLTADFQIQVARHIFLGELCRLDQNMLLDQMETNLLMLPDMGICVVACSFSVCNTRPPTKYSMAVYIFKEHMQRVATLFKIIEDRMVHLTRNIQTQKVMGAPLTSTICSRWVLSTLQNIESVMASGIPTSHISRTLFSDNPFSRYPKPFIARAFTSFLQTHGNAIVIGRREQSINLFIATLGLFLTPKQMSCSNLCDRANNFFIPDLHLQGLIVGEDIRHYVTVVDSSGHLSDPFAMKLGTIEKPNFTLEQSEDYIPDDFHVISDDLVIQSMYPTTVIDLRDLSVRQTHLYPEYTQLRGDFFQGMNELAILGDSDRMTSHESRDGPQGFVRPSWTRGDKQKSHGQPWRVMGGLFNDATQVSFMVEELLDLIVRLPDSLIQAQVTSFVRSIHRNVLSLVKLLEEDGHLTNLGPIANRRRDEIKRYLGIKSEADYLITLSFAEMYAPGTYTHFRGNPIEMEKMLGELFEEF